MQLSKSLAKKSWIEISKSALHNNLSLFRKKKGNSEIFCVVKANAYGHGLKEVVTILDKEGVAFFAVDNLDEALEIKKLGVKKEILILGYIPLSGLRLAVENGFSFTVYSLATLKRVVSDNFKKKAKIHLKVETGLNRQGVKGTKLLELAKFIRSHNEHFLVEGISTHFAEIEDTLDPSYSKLQLKNFKDSVALVHRQKLYPTYRHCACSAAAILYPETYFDALRVGISLYGLWPSKETKLAYSIKHRDHFKLEPVLSWKSVIAQIKEIKKGESVGYGRTWYAAKTSRIAVVPVGYSDGFDRGLSNCGRVIVKGNYVPVIGRVAMNMIVIDVSDVKNVKVEDEVVLIGRAKDKQITAEEIAQKTSTINYEIVARINPLISRIVID